MPEESPSILSQPTLIDEQKIRNNLIGGMDASVRHRHNRVTLVDTILHSIVAHVVAGFVAKIGAMPSLLVHVNIVPNDPNRDSEDFRIDTLLGVVNDGVSSLIEPTVVEWVRTEEIVLVKADFRARVAIEKVYGNCCYCYCHCCCKTYRSSHWVCFLYCQVEVIHAVNWMPTMTPKVSMAMTCHCRSHL
jgi:hypothetical protein